MLDQTDTLPDLALARLFTEARTFSDFRPDPVPDDLLRRLYDLVKLGPTACNSAPARFVFVRSPEAKARLAPALSKGNLAKTMAAPVTVIVGMDMAFPDTLPVLFPHVDARPWFADPKVLEENAFRNSSLQAGYLVMAARALGLDCGPMTGFDAAALEAAFFAGTRVRANLLINLGYGSTENLKPRLPRLPFHDACALA
ncbi:malonic semialdehyde reductase [Rubellimicrobium aerolatum]|uniref:Putative NADH dehydrogenase/NAD(P)H nitroreductase ACFPOC_09035 n=1 Tax=Rubellimicrobium aerolatum TaxID=490979 RepID=A0ABW0SCB7_9RHOB|nr:malonic semialdehyde reductase [Rubellimicrobium aerolatum]MBP1806274.1 3-hydroxypropanoate dehydrogenase [Rubellimicrobium aerolatum]